MAFAEVVNTSSSGMLIRGIATAAVRDRCRSELVLDGSGRRITGVAEVARHTSPRTERASGFAVRSLTLEDGGAERLERALAAAAAVRS